MRRRFRVFLILLCGLLPPVLSGGQRLAADVSSKDGPLERVADDPDRALHADRLVEQLGAVSYERRERAAQLLRQIGAVALPALRAATTHNDLEVRYRAQRLLDSIERVEQERILAEFLSQADPELGNLLPGWQRFTEFVGRDAAACKLFAQMYQEEPKIMRLSESPGPELQHLIEERSLEFRRTNRQSHSSRMTPVTLAVFLFVMLDPQVDVSSSALSTMTGTFNQTKIARALMEAGDTPFRRLISRWIAEADGVDPSQRIAVAVRFSLETGVVPALELIRSRARGSQIQNAIYAVAKLGGPQHLADLEPLLLDESVLSEQERQGRSTFTSQVRDVALVSMVSLIGQNPRDYGFEHLKEHSTYLYISNTAGFNSPEDRERALAQWKLWSQVQRVQSLAIDEIAVEGIRL